MEDFYAKASGNGKQVSSTLRLQLPICERSIGCEVAGDFSLPDYQPEIKRLLRVSATVQPPSHYIGGGTAEFTGVVDYCILYAGNDGQLYCFPTSGEYVMRAPIEPGAAFDPGEAPICFATPYAESVTGRVSGPRRLNVKCRLRADFCAYGNARMEQGRPEKLPEGCAEERLLRECDTAVCGYAQSEPIVLSDDISLAKESGNGEWRIISGDASVLVAEVNCGNDRIGVRGDVVVKLLMQELEGSDTPVTLWRKLPFDAVIESESAGVGGEAAVSGSCTELNLSMEEGRVLCEAEIVLHARTQRKETLSYVSDWYATGCESNCRTEEVNHPVPLRCINANFTQSEVKTPEEAGIHAEDTILDVTGQAMIDGVEMERGRFAVIGKCRYSLILRQADGEMGVKELEVPFRYVTDGSAVQEGDVLFRGEAIPLSTRARLDERRLALESEIGVCVRLWRMGRIAPVRSVTVGEKTERPDGQLLFCYPAETDTLWNIGKRYHTPIDALVEKNKLNDEHRADAAESLRGVRVIGI